MGLFIECPKCKGRNSIETDICTCCNGKGLKKASGKVYWIDYRVNGKRKREKIGMSKLAADNRLREVKTQIAEKRYVNVNKNTRQTLQSINDWYFELPEVKELSSIETLRGRITNVKRILGSGLSIDLLNMELINTYRDKRLQEPSARRKKSNTAIATVNKEVSALKSMLSKAVTYSKIESNPVEKCSQLKVDNVRMRVLTDNEFETLLSVSPTYLKPVLVTAFYLPMRKNEIIKLTWSEIDLKSNPGFIRLANNRTKGKKSGRPIPLHPRVREVLKKLQPNRFISDQVFLKDSKPFDDFKKSFKTALKDAKIYDFVFHDFRHCAITNLRKAGNDYSTIMKASGHKTMSMFFRYNLVDEEDVSKMKWKGENSEAKDIKAKLIAAGFNPDEVKILLDQKEQNKASNAS